MNEFTAQIFAGVWKSFKIFKSTGGIRLCNRKQYIEFTFRADGLVDVVEHQAGETKAVAKNAEWKLNLEKNKHFLHLTNNRKVYEVITINHHVMVLHEPGSGEKIFFSREADWQEHINTNKSIIL